MLKSIGIATAGVAVGVPVWAVAGGVVAIAAIGFAAGYLVAGTFCGGAVGAAVAVAQ